MILISVVEGHRFLGGFIGSNASTQEYIQERVGMWVRRIEKLSDTTVSQPQAAFAALSKVLQFEWSYLQRVVNDDSAAYLPISECLTDRFLPSILGGTISEVAVVFANTNGRTWDTRSNRIIPKCIYNL